MDPSELEELKQMGGPVGDLMNMNFSVSSIVAGLLFGIIGMWIFRQGKKRHHHRLIAIGVVLMIYPYFTPGPLTDWVVGIALCAFAKFVWHED